MQFQVRERTQYATPWRQKSHPDVEVHQIMSGTTPEGSRYTKGRLAPRELASPRYLQSPGIVFKKITGNCMESINVL